MLTSKGWPAYFIRTITATHFLVLYSRKAEKPGCRPHKKFLVQRDGYTLLPLISQDEFEYHTPEGSNGLFHKELQSGILPPGDGYEVLLIVEQTGLDRRNEKQIIAEYDTYCKIDIDFDNLKTMLNLEEKEKMEDDLNNKLKLFRTYKSAENFKMFTTIDIAEIDENIKSRMIELLKYTEDFIKISFINEILKECEEIRKWIVV